MNLCICGALQPVYIFLVPSFKPRDGEGIITRLREIDLVGTILSIGFLVCLVMGINFGGSLYSWDSAQIIVLLVLAGVLFLVFVVQQYFAFLTTESTRLFPIIFLKSKEPVLLFILTATFNATGFIPIYYIPTYFQFTRGDSALFSGVRLLPLIILITFFIILNGGSLSKGGYYMPWFLAGSILSLVGAVLLCKFPPYPHVYPKSDGFSACWHKYLGRCHLWLRSANRHWMWMRYASWLCGHSNGHQP